MMTQRRIRHQCCSMSMNELLLSDVIVAVHVWMSDKCCCVVGSSSIELYEAKRGCACPREEDRVGDEHAGDGHHAAHANTAGANQALMKRSGRSGSTVAVTGLTACAARWSGQAKARWTSAAERLAAGRVTWRCGVVALAARERQGGTLPA